MAEKILVKLKRDGSGMMVNGKPSKKGDSWIIEVPNVSRFKSLVRWYIENHFKSQGIDCRAAQESDYEWVVL